ncbi:NAD-dependent epimerase/dehydratase family protein [Nocardioides sp. Kera G14]|uniref:NAD-dependent epimerase/dehydratase family protein n=1 Tax=Nocardioides sp. Kera G14 TaxID=2884264 RepID=UPI001D0F7E37|nr:NAD(P)-dependent oxidoreductase [Nocardioides sp. Kera G14]UDY23111.1 NAD(P)-dependent oxidoreductase [Nocardioides sp. Kera G14]
MRIALTGSSGLIGSAMARHLSSEHEVITLGRRATADIQVDLSDPSAVAALDLGEVNALVHCAGVVDEDFRDHPEAALRMAVFGADALVKAAVASGATHLVYVSSAHSYGPFVGKVDESTPINPVSDYAIAHFATEQVFRRQVKEGVAGVALRPCAVFGDLPDASQFRRWSLIPFSFARDAVRDHTIVIRSTGEQRRNYVGTEDIAACGTRWLGSNAGGWGALNPLGQLSATVYEFAELCASLSEELTGIPCAITRMPPSGRTAGDDFEYTSLSAITDGTQSVSDTTRRLMQALLQEV